MKYPEIIKLFKARNIKVFSNIIFQQVTSLNYEAAKSILWRYKKRKLLTSPKRGFYYFLEFPPHNYELANILYNPSYISFETVLSEHGIIPEVVYPVISATTKPTRMFEFQEKVFKYLKIKKQAFTGYSKKENYLIADPEKALADYLYFVSLGKKRLNDRLELSRINRPLLKKYAVMFKNKNLDKLIKKI